MSEHIKKQQIRIAAVGDNCMDVYRSLGESYPGGNPVNVAVYSVRLGYEASYTGVVGNDVYGKKMIDSIQRMGVDTSHLKMKEGKTAVTYVELKKGERVLGDYEEGVMADFRLEDEDIDFLCKHDLVVTGIWGKMEDVLPAIRGCGVPVAFDFATKLDDTITDETVKIVGKSMPYVDYVFFSSDRTEEELKAQMKQIYAYGPKLVTVTRGKEGSIVYDGKSFTEFGIVPCQVVDSMGAGDSYIAGFLTALLEGRQLWECMRRGAENSSITLEYFGAWNI